MPTICKLAASLNSTRNAIHITSQDKQRLDDVVAENGAVLAFPAEERVLSRGGLLRRCLTSFAGWEVACDFGDCIIEASADSAPQSLASIRSSNYCSQFYLIGTAS